MKTQSVGRPGPNWRLIALIVQGVVFWTGAAVVLSYAVDLIPERQIHPSGVYCNEGAGIYGIWVGAAALVLAAVGVILAGVDLVLRFRLKAVAVAVTLPTVIAVAFSIGSFFYTCGIN